MDKEIITRQDFDAIFGKFHWCKVDEGTKQKIFNTFLSLNLTAEEVLLILSNAKRIAFASKSTNDSVNFKEIKPLLDSIKTKQDLKLFNYFDMVDKKLKEYYLQIETLYGEKVNLSQLDLLFKDCLKKAQEIAQHDNKYVDKFAKEVLDYFWMLASIYAAISQYVPLTNGEVLKENFVRIADGLMINSINSLDAKVFCDFKNKLDILTKRTTEEEFEIGNNLAFNEIDKLLKALTSSNIAREGFMPGEALTESEVCKLILHTKSIILLTSQEKVFGAIKVLRKHLQQVNDKFEDKFKDVKIKDIFLNSGSILAVKTNTLQDTSTLLLGGSISDLQGSGKHRNGKTLLKMMFPNMHIEGIMEEDKQHAILQSRRSIFIALNTNSLANATKSMVNCLFSALNLNETNTETFYEKVYKLEELGFNFETIFTADNIYDIFPSVFTTGKVSKVTNEDLQSNFKENILTLNKIIDVSTLQDVIKHNFKLLVDNPKSLKQKLEEIYLEYSQTKDYDKYQEDIENLLNTPPKNKSISKTTTGKKPASSKERTTKLVKREKSKILIDAAYVDVDLLKEFGCNENLQQPKPKNITSLPNHPERSNIEEINNFDILELEDEEAEDEELDPVYKAYCSDYGSLTDELIGLQNYLDALILSSNGVLSVSQTSSGTIIESITEINKSNSLVKAAKTRQILTKIDKLFADPNLANENYREEINTIISQLKLALENLENIISIYESEKQEVIENEKARIELTKQMHLTNPPTSARYIKKLIDGSLSVVAKDIAKRFSPAEAEELLSKYQKKYEECLRDENGLKQNNEENLNNFAVIESRLNVLKLFQSKLSSKLQAVSEKLRRINDEQQNKQQLIAADLLARKALLIEREKELKSKIDSANASIDKTQSFIDTRYKNKQTITSSFATRQMEKVKNKQESGKKFTKELAEVQEELRQIEQQLLDMNSSLNNPNN